MASSMIEEAKLPGGYLVTPRVPQGLAAAVEGLTREVIRNSPEDIYVFAAHHFEKLLQLREECAVTGGGGGGERSTNKTLMEMSRALRMREMDREHGKATRNPMDQVGWSLNQTAKVLKRHRSIFGEEGRRITTDEIFLMANRKENDSDSSKSPKVSVKKSGELKKSGKKSNDVWKASTSRTENSLSNEDSPDNMDVTNADRVRAGPKIITQMSNLSSGNIMLARDIKTELRKNRQSSRERRSLRARNEEKNVEEKSEKKPAKSSSKSSSKKSSEKQKKVEAESADKRSRKNNDSSRSSRDRHQVKPHGEDSSRKNEEKLKKSPPSMDRVKNYVIERFATTQSLEELQSVNYVEKVQEIIDETGPIITEKIEQLKSGVIGRSEKSSWFASTRGNRVRGSNEESPSEKSKQREVSGENSPSGNSTSDAIRTRLTETENLLENVSSSFGRSLRRSSSARSFRRTLEKPELCEDPAASRDSLTNASDNILEARLAKTRDLMEDISCSLSRPMKRSSSAKSLRKCQETSEDGGGKQDALKNRLDETRNLLRGISASFEKSRNESTIDPHDSSISEDPTTSKSSLPAVRSVSLRNSSGSVSRSDPDDLVLPAISPEAPKSAKIKENLILPVLSPPGTASTNGDSSKRLDTNDDVPLEDFGIRPEPLDDYVPEFPVENLSRDSLNVTPDFDSVPQRPDSLEPVNDLEGNALDEAKLKKEVTTPNDLGNEVLGANDLKTSLTIIDHVESKTPQDEDVGKEISASNDFANEAPEVNDLETPLAITHDLEKETTAPEDLRNEISEAADLEPQQLGVTEPPTVVPGALDPEGDKPTADDLKSRLQEIQQVQKNIEEALEPKTTIITDKSGGFDIVGKLQELEDAEKRIEKIFDLENRTAPGDTENEDQTPLEIVDGATGSSVKNAGEIITAKIESEPQATEAKAGVGKEEKMKIEVQGPENLSDKLRMTSPESLNYTYVLTEGSPYDIPDTVTTVIIPERPVESPLSETLHVEIADDLGVKLSLIPGEELEKTSIEEMVDEGTDSIDANRLQPEVEAKTVDSEDLETSEGSAEKNVTSIEETSTKKVAGSADEGEPSPESRSDPFGEFVRPQIITETSPDIEFIREIEDLQIPHQDLGPINEEVSEELEDLVDKQEAMETLRNVEKLEQDKREISLEVEKIDNGKGEENEAKKSLVTVEESKVVESDLSPEATRPNIDSESSNEAKESSIVDEPLESAKCDNSMDEEVSSATRTPESSNEIKETTLTDALSLSLDPTRPFVPELNLDSLQDITVSSFKMTEDDFEIQERGTENTNSITGTLTSDENNRNNGEFVEEPVAEYLSLSSSRSKSNEVPPQEGEEIVEETFVKVQVEIKEDVCQKTTAYVTGPSQEQDDAEKDGIQFLEMKIKKEKQAETVVESENQKSLIVETKTDEVNVPKEAREEIATAESSEPEKEETKELEKLLQEVFKDQEIVEMKRKEENLKIQSECLESVEMEEEKDEDASEVSKGEPTTFKSLIENAAIVEQVPGKGEGRESTKMDEMLQTDDSKENENTETPNSEKEDENSESETEVKRESHSSLYMENSESEATKVVENVDLLSSEKEVNVESERIEANIEKEINALNEHEINDEKKEEIDTRESEEIDSQKIEEIFTLASKEIDSQKIEEIVTLASKEIDSEKNEKISTSTLEEIDTEKKGEIDMTKKEEIKSPKMEEINGQKREEIVGDLEDTDSLKKEEVISKNVGQEKTCDSREGVGPEYSMQEMEGVREESEDVLEENFVEEETPLAVSRSASQCTTRRVSSGNLARLREDPTLSWTEEIEREDEKSENDASSSKVTFSGINNETTGEKVSKKNDENAVRPSDVSNEITGGQTTEDKEYHVYVPEVDANEDSSTIESSSFDSAVTKIQAGVRGFLTRRRLLRGLQNRSSTLSGIPSIQDSIAVEPDGLDDRVLEASEENIPRPEETSTSLAEALDDNLVDAATRIQSNYRGYKARKRLKRENAVQRTTFSLDKSFAESGLQHTGEFHDCIPLPIHDITIERKPSNLSKDPIDREKSDDFASKLIENEKIEKPATSSLSSEDIAAEPSILLDPAKMFFGTSANAQLMQFNMNPKPSQLIDLVVLAQQDAALQTGYLNFITSVEDTEATLVHAELGPKNVPVEQPNSSESLREPLALSDPPIGLVIEEVTSSIGESLTKIDEQNDQTMPSTNSSSLAPELVEKSSNSPTPSCPSSKVISGSTGMDETDGNASNRSEVEEQPTGNNEGTSHQHLVECETKKMTKKIANDGETSVMDFPASMGQFSTKEKEFLGPESSVDSMECPAVQTQKNMALGSLESKIDESGSTIHETKEQEARITSPGRDSMDSNIDDSLPSRLSFSIKVEDLLDLGSEDCIDLQGKKRFLDVTLKPTDLLKSMSLSQESQLAGERIESPITMIQIAPGSSESPQHEELSENGDNEDKKNGGNKSHPNSTKSD